MVICSIRSLCKKSAFFFCSAYCAASGALAAYAEPAQEFENSSGIDWSQHGFKLIFIAAGIYILVRAFSRRRKTHTDRSQPWSGPAAEKKDDSPQHSFEAETTFENTGFDKKPYDAGKPLSPREQRARAAWGVLMTRDAGSRQTAGALETQGDAAAAFTESGTPEEEFIRGAKLLYSRIYEDMDANDLEDIRNFATDNGFSQIQTLMERKDHAGATDLLLVNAHIRQLDETAAVVQFNTLMRKPGQTAPKEIQEVWRFTRANPNQTWMVDSLEQ